MLAEGNIEAKGKYWPFEGYLENSKDKANQKTMLSNVTQETHYREHIRVGSEV